MIARSFQNITVGDMLKGAIVAIGTEGLSDGTIASVQVGYRDVGPPVLRYIRQNVFLANRPGFSGSSGQGTPPILAPFEGPFRANWFGRHLEDRFTTGTVIRAADSIGTLDLRSMSSSLSATDDKNGKPRVESPHIGSLQIGLFDSGVIWSGRLDSPGPGNQITNVMDNDYATIDQVSIGCIGPRADLWVDDNTNVDVSGDMFGEIHLPQLGSNQTLRIGGRLGDLPQAGAVVPGTSCLDLTEGNPDYGQELPFDTDPYIYLESSPRGVWSAVESANFNTQGVADRGMVILQDSNSLKGQIIIDASNTTGEHRLDSWKGDVVIGTGTPDQPLTPIVISTDSARASSAAAVAPLYSLASGVLGGSTDPADRGGAIGLFPFARYDADCTPLNLLRPGLSQLSSDYVRNAPEFWSDSKRVDVAYYGPIAKIGDGVTVNRVHPQNAAVTGTISPDLYDTLVSASRVLSIKNGNVDLPGGRYNVMPMTEPGNTLWADPGIPADPGVSFALSPVFQPPANPDLPRYDFLLGGTLTGCSSPFCFFADFTDWDSDDPSARSVDGDDVIAFFAVWDVSGVEADVNVDGGTDGDDVVEFFCWWDANGCNY